jgi:hypothetical protein
MITFKQLLSELSEYMTESADEFTMKYEGGGLRVSGGGLKGTSMVPQRMDKDFNSFDLSGVSGPLKSIIGIADAIAAKRGGWSNINYAQLPASATGEKAGNALAAAHGGTVKKMYGSRNKAIYAYYPNSDDS